MRRYTVRVSRPIEAAEMDRDPEGNFVQYEEVEDLEIRVRRARTILGAAYVVDGLNPRDAIGKALDALEGR